MPFPYVSPDRLEREITYEASDFDIDTESDWEDLLTDALKAASERIDGWTDDGVSWRGSDDADVPFIVREAVIRLARQRIAGIREDGISKEDLVSGAGYDYRPPQEIRAEIKTALDDAGYRSGRGIFVPEVK